MLERKKKGGGKERERERRGERENTWTRKIGITLKKNVKYIGSLLLPKMHCNRL